MGGYATRADVWSGRDKGEVRTSDESRVYSWRYVYVAIDPAGCASIPTLRPCGVRPAVCRVAYACTHKHEDTETQGSREIPRDSIWSTVMIMNTEQESFGCHLSQSHTAIGPDFIVFYLYFDLPNIAPVHTTQSATDKQHHRSFEHHASTVVEPAQLTICVTVKQEHINPCRYLLRECNNYTRKTERKSYRKLQQ
ncbi:hypothetical protein CBL_11635 [Carabus blaptoides fortunei]